MKNNRGCTHITGNDISDRHTKYCDQEGTFDNHLTNRETFTIHRVQRILQVRANEVINRWHGINTACLNQWKWHEYQIANSKYWIVWLTA